MIIYMPLNSDGYELCHPVHKDDFERINVLINGVPRHAEWIPIPMKIIREDEGRTLAASDAPWLGDHALIFRPRAVEVLEEMLREFGELLPLSCEGVKLHIYNAIQIVDALDEGASSVVRFSNGRIMMIQRHVFRRDVLRGLEIFKIPNLRASPTFVSEAFVKLWSSAGLKGLQFEQVWTTT